MELLTASGKRIITIGHYDDTKGLRVIFRDNITILGDGKTEWVEFIKNGKALNCTLYRGPSDLEDTFHNETDEDFVWNATWNGDSEVSWKQDTTVELYADEEEELIEFLANN